MTMSSLSILFELHNFNFNLCSKQNNKINLLHQIVATQLTGGWQHNHSTKKRQAGRKNEQFIFSL
jgi:hypothetical protein